MRNALIALCMLAAPPRARTNYFSEIRFERDAAGKVTGMRVSAGRVRDLKFEKLP